MTHNHLAEESEDLNTPIEDLEDLEDVVATLERQSLV